MTADERVPLVLEAGFDTAWYSAVAHYHKADSLIRFGCAEEALAELQRTVALDPSNKDAHFLMGLVSLSKNEFSDAFDAFSKVLSISPFDLGATVSAANAILGMGRMDEALKLYEKALQIDSRCFEAQSNKGHILFKLGQYAEAVRQFQEALTIAESADVRYNKGRAHESLGEYADALLEYHKAIRVDPNHAKANWNRSLLLLKQGAFAAGWACYGYRFANPESRVEARVTSRPVWSPKLGDSTTLIWSEQGVGEEVLFAGWFAAVRELSASVVLAVDRRLFPVYQRSFPELAFVDKGASISESIYDSHLPMGAVPKALIDKGRDWFGRRSRFPYLKVDVDRAALIAAELRKDPSRIYCGISWRSNRPGLGVDKSLELTELLSKLHVEGVTFVDLQYGDTSRDLDVLHAETGLRVFRHEEVDNFTDLEGHLALINACDLVVTVCNTTAHLAGAIGKRGLVLRRSPRSDFWYWHNLVKDRSIWYPSLTVLDAKEFLVARPVDLAGFLPKSSGFPPD